jgi:hypothetical protein
MARPKTDEPAAPPAIETIPRRPPEPPDLPELPEEPAAAKPETLERLPPALLHLTLEAKGRVIAWAPKATDTGQVCRITFETSDIDGADLELLWSAQPFLAHMTLTFSGRSQRMPMAAEAREIAGEPLAEVRVGIGVAGLESAGDEGAAPIEAEMPAEEAPVG